MTDDDLACGAASASDDEGGIGGPAEFTRLVSSIYRMAPDNPFNLGIQSQRERAPAERRPRFPLVALGDRPLDEGLALCLWYGAFGADGSRGGDA